MDHQDQFLKLVHEAKKNIQEIDPQLLHSMISAKYSFMLLDVRENDEWVNGHIAQALHIPRGILERDIENLVPDKHTPLVVYCGGGYRSALACDNLQKMGYKNVKSLAGGIKAWVVSGGTLI